MYLWIPLKKTIFATANDLLTYEMKKNFAILSFLVLLLLVVSQIIWIIQIAERDKNRFKGELSATINNVVKYQATKQTYELFEIDPELPSITIETVNPDSLPAHAKSYGSYETGSFEENNSLAQFLEGAMTEMLLEKKSLDLHVTDSLFRSNFPYASELLAYSLKMRQNNITVDSLIYGNNAAKQLDNTAKGVYITIPLGTSGTYQFVSQYVFKPAVVTRRLMNLVWLSGVAVIAVACILFALLFQLQRQMNRLQRQEKRVRGIIHDLKSPLSYIYSMLESFDIKGKNAILTEGKSRVKRLSDSIERMLMEVRLDDKKNAALQRESYNLTEHCMEIAKDLQLIHKEKKIAITITITPEAQMLYVDPFYFDNCLRNLLENSIKYSENDPVIIITGQKEKNKIVISVADNGKGIPQKEQRSIFNSFYRSSSQSAVKGHGLGLSSVEGIVKAHGGNIHLQSDEGKGSIFTITIKDTSGMLKSK